MKLNLCFVLFLLITNAFAQDNYHTENRPTCQAEACLFSNDIQIGFSSYYDEHDDFTYKFLNTDSTLEDVLYKDSLECYRGQKSEICAIIDALAGNSEANYYMNGGHTRILAVQCNGTQIGSQIEVIYTAKSDYDRENYQLKKVIPLCL